MICSGLNIHRLISGLFITLPSLGMLSTGIWKQLLLGPGRIEYYESNNRVKGVR